MNQCGCGLCGFLRSYVGTHGGWCDPRRGYRESEKDFLVRVPDGFSQWPENHIDVQDSVKRCSSYSVMWRGGWGGDHV